MQVQVQVQVQAALCVSVRFSIEHLLRVSQLLVTTIRTGQSQSHTYSCIFPPAPPALSRGASTRD